MKNIINIKNINRSDVNKMDLIQKLSENINNNNKTSSKSKKHPEVVSHEHIKDSIKMQEKIILKDKLPKFFTKNTKLKSSIFSNYKDVCEYNEPFHRTKSHYSSILHPSLKNTNKIFSSMISKFRVKQLKELNYSLARKRWIKAIRKVRLYIYIFILFLFFYFIF
jgi:hypothetical protein